MESLDIIAQLVADLLGLGQARYVYWLLGLGLLLVVVLGLPRPAPPPKRAPPPSVDDLEIKKLEGTLAMKKAEVGILEHQIQAKKRAKEEAPRE